MSVDILTISSKGQVVLPATIRKALSLVSGDKLLAYSSGDAILLKPLEIPKEDECQKWLEDARAWAAESGLSEDDIPGIIAEVRTRRGA